MSEAASDSRLDFDAAVRLVQRQPERAAFAAVPVFGDDGQAAEGARVFIVEADGAGGWRVRFIAGPFFSSAFGANETLVPDEVPERVRELMFMPTRVEEEWLEGQIQILIQKLMQAAGQAPPQMPDYAAAPAVHADAETVFPVSFVGKGDPS